MNKYQHKGRVHFSISTSFNLQLFANKLISLDRMKDFLDGSKSIFYMESDLANENEISGIVEDKLIPKPVDLSYYAKNSIPDFKNITEIPQNNLAYLNSGLTASSMSYMFNECNKLQSIPKLNINTSQCTDMRRMFDNCQVLTTIDLSNFDTNKVTDMNGMFYYCESLASIDLSNFDTSSVTDMISMFNTCRLLASLDLSNWDTSNVTGMNSMFSSCNSLTTIDLSNFNTSKVTDMGYMFYYCQALEHIEGIIDMKSCSDYGYSNMFYRCNKLSGVKIKNPPQAYYDDKSTFESEIKLASDQYEIVS